MTGKDRKTVIITISELFAEYAVEYEKETSAHARAVGIGQMLAVCRMAGDLGFTDLSDDLLEKTMLVGGL